MVLTNLRIPGALQRIAVCYLAACSTFLVTRVRGPAVAILLLLAGYWALTYVVLLYRVAYGMYRHRWLIKF